jgi:hypothetical protein
MEGYGVTGLLFLYHTSGTSGFAGGTIRVEAQRGPWLVRPSRLQRTARSTQHGGRRDTANCRRGRHRNTGCEEAASKAEVGGF